MAYVAQTASTIRGFVREITDLDVADLPDSLLNMYIRDGYNRILDLEKRWKFLEETFTFPTVANQRAYTVANFTADPIREVVSIVDNTGIGSRLDMIGYDMAEESYIGSYDVAGNPLFYAVWDGQIHLYPKPSNVRTLICRGYREPADWITSGGDVDAAKNLHLPLVYYACSRIYQRLEDTGMSAEYKRAFDEGVALARNAEMKPVSHAHLVLSHGQTRGRPTFKGYLQQLGRTLGP